MPALGSAPEGPDVARVAGAGDGDGADVVEGLGEPGGRALASLRNGGAEGDQAALDRLVAPLLLAPST